MDDPRGGASTAGSARGPPSPARLRHARLRALVRMEEGEIPGAEADLTILIEGLDPRGSVPLLKELYDLHQGRATVRRRANQWKGALEDLEAAERLIERLPAYCRRRERAAVAHARAKILADPLYPAADAAAAVDSLAAVREAGGPELTAAADELESQLAYRAGRWEAAARLARRAAARLEGAGWQAGAAACHLRAAEALTESGELDQAEAELRAAKAHVDQLGSPGDIAHTELVNAKLASARGESDAAWDGIVTALGRFDLLIRHFRVLSEQQRFLLDKLNRYEEAFRIALDGGGERSWMRAWEVAERSKAFYLCQLLASADVGLFEDVDPEKLEALEALDRELDERERKLDRIPEAHRAGERARTLTSKLAELSEQKRDLMESLMRENPRWGAVAAPRRFDLQEAIAGLPRGWIPVSFYWEAAASGTPAAFRAREEGGAILNIFWTDRGGQPRHLRRRWTSEELGLLRRTRRRLRGHVPWGAPPMSHRLTDLILPPETRDSLPDDARLLISPHGLLQMVPLGALPLDDGYIISEWPVQYVPTLSLLPLTRASTGADDVLLLGCEQDGFGGRPLKEIPDELKSLKRLWSASGDRMVVPRLVPTAGSPEEEGVPVTSWGRFGIVHVASHGSFPLGRPFDAALRLGSATVRTSDFFRVRLDVGLATLSACSVGRHAETSGDVPVVGDEWIGLYLPMLYGGARCIVASLWDAYSEPAARFMYRLHFAVSEGKAPVDAARRAQALTATEYLGAPPAVWSNWYTVGLPSRLS